MEEAMVTELSEPIVERHCIALVALNAKLHALENRPELGAPKDVVVAHCRGIVVSSAKALLEAVPDKYKLVLVSILGGNPTESDEADHTCVIMWLTNLQHIRCCA